MSKIWVSSDWHFMHNRGFIYEPRGFQNVHEAANAILGNHNALVSPEDDVYVFGDLMLNNNEIGLEYIKSMNGKLHIIRGNHDTDTRVALYKELPNVVEVLDAAYLRYKGYHFYFTHFPCITANLEKESLKQCTINIHGHTHSKDKFYQDMPFCFHCGVDAHDNEPVLLDDVIQMCEAKVVECKAQL
jgi:calcineurin-like phosphoesterase family protein